MKCRQVLLLLLIWQTLSFATAAFFCIPSSKCKFKAGAPLKMPSILISYCYCRITFFFCNFRYKQVLFLLLLCWTFSLSTAAFLHSCSISCYTILAAGRCYFCIKAFDLHLKGWAEPFLHSLKIRQVNAWLDMKRSFLTLSNSFFMTLLLWQYAFALKNFFNETDNDDVYIVVSLCRFAESWRSCVCSDTAHCSGDFVSAHELELWWHCSSTAL